MQPTQERLQTKRAIFVDRDGVINDVVIRNGKSYPPPTVEEYRFLPKVPEAVRKLKDAGFVIIVVTNQPDVGNKIQRQEVVEEMHQIIYRELRVDDIEVCYHTSKDECLCRKPKPGMILNAARKWSIDIENSFMVGDRWTDVTAGKTAGCKTFLVGHGYAEEKTTTPDWYVDSLFEACEIVLSQGQTTG